MAVAISTEKSAQGALFSFSESKTITMRRKLQPVTRILLVVLSLSMLLAFFFPFWHIWLDAPQYPEGLSIQIWIYKLAGEINTINGLNHYIGMKHITPETFKELVYMPYILGFLIGLGLLSALINRKFLFLIFAALLIVAGTAGTIDFYMWEYNYGHNLDLTAAIIVPGMSYQPPMIGSKELLNFVATAWPGVGGWSVIIAGFAIAFLARYELRKK
jgi:copper chaperone NosL